MDGVQWFLVITIQIDKAAQTQYDLGNKVSVASINGRTCWNIDRYDRHSRLGLFEKNGGDSTQLAVMVAREETGNQKFEN